jgi:hypothetical protein
VAEIPQLEEFEEYWTEENEQFNTDIEDVVDAIIGISVTTDDVNEQHIKIALSQKQNTKKYLGWKMIQDQKVKALLNVENCFGVIKQKWKIWNLVWMKKTITKTITRKKKQKIVKATIYWLRPKSEIT